MKLVHALSFDVEEHFQVANFAAVIPRDRWDREPSRVEANVERILARLDAAKTKATFFTLGWVAERHTSLVKSIVARGHELASHGYDHRFVDALGESGFREDVRKTKKILEDASGAPIVGFRASTFTITRRTPWALGILAEEGYRYDASIFPVRHPTYGIPDAPRHPRVEALEGGARSWSSRRSRGDSWERTWRPAAADISDCFPTPTRATPSPARSARGSRDRCTCIRGSSIRANPTFPRGRSPTFATG